MHNTFYQNAVHCKEKENVVYFSVVFVFKLRGGGAYD